MHSRKKQNQRLHPFVFDGKLSKVQFEDFISLSVKVARVISVLALILCGIFLLDSFLTPNQEVSIAEFIEINEEFILVKVGEHFFHTDAPPLNIYEAGDTLSVYSTPIFDIVIQVDSYDPVLKVRSDNPENNSTHSMYLLSFAIAFTSLYSLRSNHKKVIAGMGAITIFWVIIFLHVLLN